MFGEGRGPKVTKASSSHKTAVTKVPARSIHEGPRCNELIRRYYEWSTSDFHKTLTAYNEMIRKCYLSGDNNELSSSSPGAEIEELYECVGYANTRMQFCTRCFDLGKETRQELYYVDISHIAQHRRTMCYGCLGYILKQYNDNKQLTTYC